MTQKHEGAQEVIFGPDTPRISQDNVEEEDFIA
jgi:hypothetical protein